MFYRYRDVQPGEFYVVFGDTAAGGGDNCAVQFLSTKWLDVPIVYHSKVTASFMTPLIHEELRRISKQTNIRPKVAFERNNGGGFEMDRMARLNRYHEYDIYTMKNLNPYGKLVDTGKLGYDTNTATRPKMLADLKDAVESQVLHLYHRATVDEMFSFIISSSGKPEAEEGAHDDLVMSLAGAWQMYQTEQVPAEDGSGVVETIPLGRGYKEAGILIARDNLYD